MRHFAQSCSDEDVSWKTVQEKTAVADEQMAFVMIQFLYSPGAQWCFLTKMALKSPTCF